MVAVVGRLLYHTSFIRRLDLEYCCYYSRPIGVRSIVINPFVCVSVCLSASISLEPLDRTSRNYIVQISCDRGSVFFWWRCATLCTSGFMSRLTVMGGMMLGGRPDLLLAVSYLRDRGGV